MPFFAPLLAGLGTAAGYAGTAAGHPLGQAAIGIGMQTLANRYNQPQEQNQDVAMQQQYRQQLQQPFQLNSQQRQQQLMNRFNQQILPGIKEQFSGLGGLRSSAFGQQIGSALGDLGTNLGALGEENALNEATLNQNRLGQMGGYLGNQQQLGLQATIANRDAMLRQMGLMQNYSLGREQNNISRQNVFGNVLSGLRGTGMQNQFDTVNKPGQVAGIQDFATELARAYMRMR